MNYDKFFARQAKNARKLLRYTDTPEARRARELTENDPRFVPQTYPEPVDDPWLEQVMVADRTKHETFSARIKELSGNLPPYHPKFLKRVPIEWSWPRRFADVVTINEGTFPPLDECVLIKNRA